MSITLLLILPYILTFICTEYLLDNSIYYKYPLLVIILSLLIIINIIFYYKRYLTMIICLVIYSNLLYLFINRQLVYKFVVDPSFKIVHPINDDIFVYYIISHNNIKTESIKDINLEFDKLKSYISKILNKRDNNVSILIKYDFSDVVFDFKKFCDLMDKIYFSKFGSKICFVFKVPCVTIRKLSQIKNSEKDDYEDSKDNEDDIIEDIPFCPPPPPPSQQFMQSNNNLNKNKIYKQNNKFEDEDMQKKFQEELQNRIEERRKKMLKSS